MKRASFCQRGDVRIAYARAGSGPVVVFLHGVGGNRRNWEGQLAHLSAHFTCVAWDARGYGDSDDPDQPLAFADFAEDLRALLASLGASRAHLVGLSMGGFIAQDFYARYPASVATLTLASTSAGAGLLTQQARDDFLARRLRPLEEGASMREVAHGLVSVLAGSRADDAVRAKLRRSLEALRTEPYKQTLRALVTTDFRDGLARIAVPTLVIVGDEDRVLPEPESRLLSARIPRSRLVVLPGVGHLCNLEAPAAFDAALLDFLLANSDQGASHLPAEVK